MTDNPQKTVRITPSAAVPGAGSPLASLAVRYQLLGEIGSGGMGVVYQARDRETGEIVALKVLRPEIACLPGMLERFKNELRLSRRITHKNVCRIYDFSRAGDLVYISMEYVDGESLRAHLRRVTTMPLAQGLDLARQICAGLIEAHAQGVIHRDLKPENVMLARSGEVKLMDFGIARLVEGETATTHSFLGTPAYMSPEQANGKAVDRRTDIYSLGLILYECLTGRRTFTGDTPVAVALKQVQEKPVAPRALAPVIPRSVETVIMRCLEKDPAQRFASARSVQEALTVRPPPAASPNRRWPRWLGLFLLLVVAGIVIPKFNKSPHPAAPAPSARAQAGETGGVPSHAPSPSAEADRDYTDDTKKYARMRQRLQQLRRTADSGDPQAQTKLGNLFLQGPEVLRDDRKAFHWFQRAARLGHAVAQYHLARMYEDGRGQEKDPAQAYAWYSLAAAGGHHRARFSLDKLKRNNDPRLTAAGERRARELSETIKR